MTLESKVLEIIEGKKSAPLSRALLRVMSHCYQAGAYLHRFAYDLVIPTTKLSIPVVSVGNIVAGGSGKTPFVHYLAEKLSSSMSVAILSRGYGRKSSKTVVVDSSTTAEECGDEPYFLAQKLPQAKVIVDRKRTFSGHLATTLEAKIAILDDGLQYHPLERDFDIVVMDARDLFGKGFYLPRGLLRDSPKRLKNANHIILNGVFAEEEFEKAVAQIRKWSEAPITAMELKVKNSTELASKKVTSFCAIANPARFQKTLGRLGCDVVEKLEKGDHQPFTVDELDRLANRAKEKGAEIVVCTEKDRVKLPEKLSLSLPLIPVEVTLVPKFGKEKLDHLIKQILEMIDE